MALASQWVARIFAISLLMILPGIAGQWLDSRLGTKFLALIGFGLGFCAGFIGLLALVNSKPSSGVMMPGETTVSKNEFDQGDGDSGER